MGEFDPGQPDFIDYYELMQISPNAEAETVHRVFRMLAARYHPDNPETGDQSKFVRLNEAYRVLSRSEMRAEYDAQLHARTFQPMSIFEMKEFAAGIDGEPNRRLGILCLLYKQRRANPDRPGLSILDLEAIMSFPREHLMFTLWYLKDQDLARQDESSNFVITGKGVDFVERNLASHSTLYKLLKSAEQGDVQRSEQTWAPPTASQDAI
jgi:curved DNA-binding protein CbpA